MDQSQQITKQSMPSVVKIKHFWLPIFLIFFGAIEVNARCSRRCSKGEFTICYPIGNETCQKCPKCPAGNGLPIQCGSKVANGTSTECIPCVANTYSLTHDSSTCRPCRDPCGGKKMITECTAIQNRKCDSTCQDPNYYFNSENDECRECYFCCDTVSEGERLQQCKDIGMPRNKQCEKTNKNKQCKLASDPSTPHAPTTDEHASTTDEHVSTTDEHVSTTDEHVSTSDGHVSTTDGHVSTTDGHSIDDSSTLKDKDNKGPITTQAFLVAVPACLVVICLGIIIIKGTLRIHDRREQPYRYVPKPNPAVIPADRLVSDMESLRDEEDNVMFIHVQDMLDAAETSTRRTWRSVGRAFEVSSVQLDLIETDYIARRSPTESLLTILKTSLAKEPTMREFVKALINCNRNDVASYICNWPWKIEKIASMGEDQHQKVQDQVIIELGKL